jgi:hypothetical protein
MANTRALATAGLLLTLASGTSIATSPQDMAAQAKSCKALSDDKQRLKCFDHLFGDTPKLEKSEVGRPANWSIEETKSPDGSPQVVAANLVNDTVLILRCKDQITEAGNRVYSVTAGQRKTIHKNDPQPLMEKIKEGNFNLGAVSEVRNKIAKACDWDNAPVDEPVGSTTDH